jgi:NADH-ubiquinone oxidoreductase chain 4
MCIISLVYSSLTTLRQVDIKQLVAYSSVAHMAVVVLGLFSNNIIGIEGGLLLSIAHGFVSPALFILVGGVLYDRYHTRLIKYYRGLSNIMPLFAFAFTLFTLANIGTPGSFNFIGEILCLAGVFNANIIVGILGATGIILSAAYGV